MNYFQYLKKKFPVYIISGVVLSLAAFMAISLYRYDNHLFNVLSDMQTIVLNKNKIQGKVEEIDSMVSTLKSQYHIDITEVNAERQILRTLDTLKDHMPEASITATKFNRDADTMQLPVAIQLDIENYNRLVNAVEYVGSLRMPDYKIKRLYISESAPGELVMLINGDLSMPDLK